MFNLATSLNDGQSFNNELLEHSIEEGFDRVKIYLDLEEVIKVKEPFFILVSYATKPSGLTSLSDAKGDYYSKYVTIQPSSLARRFLIADLEVKGDSLYIEISSGILSGQINLNVSGGEYVSDKFKVGDVLVGPSSNFLIQPDSSYILQADGVSKIIINVT